MAIAGKFKVSLAALFACASIGTANAIPIVDTGTPSDLEDFFSAFPILRDELASDHYQFLAGRFTTTEAYAITELSVFVRDHTCCGMPDSQFGLAIASGPDVPEGEQFTNLFEVQTSFSAANGWDGWAGAAVDNYLLTAGTYWIVAFVPEGLVTHLSVPGWVPNPMDAYAWYNGLNAGWITFEGEEPRSNLAFRVDGVPVPEPGAFALMLAAFLGMLTVVRQRRA